MSCSRTEERAGYKLVPQSNSDDSELSDEELRSLNRDGFQIITRKFLHSSRPFRMSTNQRMLPNKNKTNTETDRTNIFVSSFKQNKKHNELDYMSWQRKISLIFSILVCFTVVAVFLLVPCHWANFCHRAITRPSTEIWTKTLPNIELVGPITPVFSVDQDNFNFVFLARGCVFADVPVIRTNFTSSFGGDALCLNGLTGRQLWRKHFNKMPHDLDCSILSSRNEAQKDCIVISYLNFLAVLSPETGQIRWSTPITSKNNKTRQIFPILIPAANRTNATDLLLVKDINKLMVISGRLGVAISDDFKSLSLNCSEIKNLRLSRDYHLLLDCTKTNKTHYNSSISLDGGTSINTTSKILQHQPFETSNQLTVRTLTISVANEGFVCPRQCKSAVQIRSSLQKKIVWSHEFNSTYAMTPQAFDLTSVTGVYGFIFKIWEHEHESTELKKLNMFQNSKKLTINIIRERTIMILFNESTSEYAQTTNLSIYPIMQLYDAQKSVQPDPVSQRHSLFILDLWSNGSHQLISYHSTFEDERKNENSITDYMLRSYVHMYDLRREVLKTYNFSSH